MLGPNLYDIHNYNKDYRKNQTSEFIWAIFINYVLLLKLERTNALVTYKICHYEPHL